MLQQNLKSPDELEAEDREAQSAVSYISVREGAYFVSSYDGFSTETSRIDKKRDSEGSAGCSRADEDALRCSQ